MKKLHSFIACTFVACLTLVLFSSCEGGSGNSLSGYAPKSIVGKTFYSNNWWHDMTFETSSTFSLDYEEDRHHKIVGTPTYSYRKVGDDIAELTFEYTIETYGYTGADSYLNRIYNPDKRVILHFTSEEAGWFTCDDVEYKDFTLY